MGEAFQSSIGDKVSLCLQCYFRSRHQALMEEAERLIRRFVETVSFRALEYFYNTEGDPEPLTRQSFEDLMDLWFRGDFKGYPNATIFLQGASADDPQFGAEYGGRDLIDEEVSFLSFWVPAGYFFDHRSELLDLFADMTTVPGAVSGYVSPALRAGSQSDKQARGSRFYGIDIANPEFVAIDLGTLSPGAYWTNFLSAASGVKATDLAAIPVPARNQISVAPHGPGGLLVRLEENPRLLDKNRNEDMTVYRSFAEVLDSKSALHVPRRVTYFQDRDGASDPDAQERWHRRFLEP